MKTSRAPLLIALVLLGTQALAQDAVKTFGKSEAKRAVDDVVKPIYEKAGPWTHTLEKRNDAELSGADGSEINGSLIEGRFARLYVGAWTKSGKYAAEYYLQRGQVAFVYETFEYFESAAPRGEWRNFKGLAAWERRTYVDNGVVVYAESKGLTAPDLLTTPDELQRKATSYVARLEAKRGRG
jgi:hypothetical protein